MFHFLKTASAISFVTLALACSNVVAQTEVLVSDFETDLSSTLGPTWTTGDGATAQVVSGLGFEPQGSGMLEITHSESWTSTLPAMILSGQEVADAISISTELKFDIVPPQDFGYRQVFIVFNSSLLNGWTQFGAFDSTSLPEVATEIDFDLTQDVTDRNSMVRPLNEVAGDAYDVNTDYWQMLLIFQGVDNLPLGTSITYLDNVRLVQGASVDVDLDDDGDVDGNDFLLIQRSDPSLIPAWQAAYGGAPLAGGLSVVAIPEPSSAVLLLLAICGGIHRRRR